MATNGTPRWDRTSGWRQGCVLPAEASEALGLRHAAHPHETCVVVVGHSCDVASDDLGAEPDVEVIIGHRLAQVDPNLTRTKSPRRLHLPMQVDGLTVGVDLHATAKRLVPKLKLVPWKPDPRIRFDADALTALQIWLAIRYRRAAFPDEFDRRMSHEKLDERLHKIAKRYDHVVSGIYFLLSEQADLGPATPYRLQITVLFEPGDEPEEYADVADEAVNEIVAAFRSRCYEETTKTWRHFELLDAMSISEEDATISRMKRLQQRRFDFVSLNPEKKSAQTPEI